ncbi:MAG: thioredoxin domain-containing protein [Thermoplasmataceae archaeon]
MSGSHNRLISEKSPYLLQHAHNPVDWFPWSEEAFETAKRLDKPIFLSIGYSTCHWCHVMEKESFEDPRVGEKMNETFISIKVDREERPDVDHFYMNVSQRMTGTGGWPLNVIMTPDRKPIFTMTYIPKVSRNGQMGIIELCDSVRSLWTEHRRELLEQADGIVESVKLQQDGKTSTVNYKEIMSSAFEQFRKSYDSDFGGFGGRPKFPTPHNYSFLLRYYLRNGDSAALEMVVHSLKAMRRGGIFDQVGYGFHRYSTDSSWTVPHFEKMLYDQGLLLRAYAEAYMVTRNEFFRRVVEEMVSFLSRELVSPEGGFYSALDADSEGEEGKFYTWTTTELQSLLGPDFDLFSSIFNVTRTGNYHDEATGRGTGKNILYLTEEIAALADSNGIPAKELENRIKGWRSVLMERRNMRTRPGTDTKILTDMNCLAISGLAVAYIATGMKEAIWLAERAMGFLEKNMVEGDTVFHSWVDGTRGKFGFLPDYSYLVGALVDMHQATLDDRYFREAVRIDRIIRNKFGSEKGGFYFADRNLSEVPSPTMDDSDGAIPSGNSMEVFNMARLRILTEDPETTALMDGATGRLDRHLVNSPMYFSMMLCGLDIAQGPTYSVTIRVRKESALTEAIALCRGRNYSILQIKSAGISEKGTDDSILVCGPSSCLPAMHSVGEFRNWSEKVQSLGNGT